MILAGDIGGTKTHLRLTRERGDAPGQQGAEALYVSADYPDLATLVCSFLAERAPTAQTRAACFAVAGPVTGKLASLTNLPWSLDADQLSQVLAIPQLCLINDLQAVGHAVDVLTPEDVLTLQEGEIRERAPRAVIAAGTGLGQAMLIQDGTTTQVLASEGGHVDFAPRDVLQTRLLSHLMERFGHVSYERVCSGPGLMNIHAFLNGESGNSNLNTRDPVAISRAAAENDATARQTLDIFFDALGAQAGNLALTSLAFGGIYLAGGISAKLADDLRASSFLQAFADKGRMRNLLEHIPIKLIINESAGLLGAESVARGLIVEDWI